jgi:hypothetical protein
MSAPRRHKPNPLLGKSHAHDAVTPPRRGLNGDFASMMSALMVVELQLKYGTAKPGGPRKQLDLIDPDSNGHQDEDRMPVD